MTAPVVDADTGRVALTRAQLTALVELATGPVQVGETDAEAEHDLRAAGALRGDEPHPLVRPVVATLSAVRSRGALRRWVGGPRPVVEILVGGAGIVVLPGGLEPEAVQEVRWHPRASAVGRIVAEMLDLPTEDGPPVLDPSPRPWSELVGLASRRDTGIGLADLRWAGGVRHPLASVLVIAWHRDGGIVEVRPAETTPPGTAETGEHARGTAGTSHDDGGGMPFAIEPDIDVRHSRSSAGTGASPAERQRDPASADRLVRCTPRHPVEVWTGLTKLSSRAARLTTRGGLMV